VDDFFLLLTGYQAFTRRLKPLFFLVLPAFVSANFLFVRIIPTIRDSVFCSVFPQEWFSPFYDLPFFLKSLPPGPKDQLFLRVRFGFF